MTAAVARIEVGTSEGAAVRAARVAAIASQHADAVDAEGRFPREAVDAMRAEKLLSIQIPADLGGEGASITEIAELCSILGQACAASAMVFAMHHIKLSSLVEHGADSEWHRDFMSRIASEQLLLASATTEGGIGGNLRNSICAIEVEGDTCTLEKDATVISYGAHADAILITSRSHAEAASSDQALTVFLRDQYTLERTIEWNTLGMRGTCSDGFLFKGEAPAVQILPKPFADEALPSGNGVAARRLVRHCGRCRCPCSGFRARSGPQIAGHAAAGCIAAGGSLQSAADGEVECRCRS